MPGEWISLLKKSLKVARNDATSRYYQLATVDENGLPDNRTVVHRALNEQDGSLLMLTDMRSRKWGHLSRVPKVSICWYFGKCRLQFRIKADAKLITRPGAENNVSHVQLGDAQLVEDYWVRLSDAGKKQFLWGEPRTAKPFDVPLTIGSDLITVPEHFALVRFMPYEVDVLDLKGNPQQRTVYRKVAKDTWRSDGVIP